MNEDYKVVITPGSWTAVSIEPGAGETMMSNDAVVVDDEAMKS